MLLSDITMKFKWNFLLENEGEIILYINMIKTEFAKVCSGLEIFQVANTPRILKFIILYLNS